MSASRIFVLMLTCLILSGCAPAFFTYRYISLEENDDLRILAYGESSVPNLFFDGQMPTKYKLERGHYNLLFEIDREKYSPNITVVAESHDGTVTRVSHYEAASNLRCARYDYFDRTRQLSLPNASIDKNRPYLLVYTIASCNPDQFPQAMAIEFDVINHEGSLVGSEFIPFKLINNGYYIVLDAI